MSRMPSRYLLSRHLDMRLHVFAGWTRARLFTSADAARTGFIGDKKKKRRDRDGCEKEGEGGGRDERTDAAKKIEKIPRQMLYRVYEINVETTCNGVVSSIPIIYLLSPQVQRRDAFHMVIFYLFFYGWCTAH